MNNLTSKHLLLKTSAVSIHFCPTDNSGFKLDSEGNPKITRAMNFLRKVIQQSRATPLCFEVILLFASGCGAFSLNGHTQ